MKLLLDQNLSRKIVPHIQSDHPGSCHLTSVLQPSADDVSIWQYAKEHGFAIVTKDDDFERRSVLHGHPPKIIWIRLGNCATADVVALLQRSSAVIKSFLNDEDKSILAIP